MNAFLDWERFIHSLKTAIACLIGFALTRAIGLPADQWVVITILVVMCSQLYVGSVMQKAYWRFFGTVAGCLAASILILSGYHNFLATAITLMVSGFVFSYFATWREDLTYAGTLGAVTTAIIILGQEPTMLFALERFLEISIGLLIATLVSQFALPIHARTHLRYNQATTLTQLRDYYQMMMTHANDSKDPLEMDETIIKSLLKQRQLAKESVRERMGLLFDAVHFNKTLSAEREMLRAVAFMHSALLQITSPLIDFMQSDSLKNFNDTIVQSLNVLITTLEKNNSSEEHIHLPAIAPLKQTLESAADKFTREELIYMDGFLFCAERLVGSLKQLAELYQVKIYSD